MVAILPESFIILICTQDLFEQNFPVYRRKIVIEGCEEANYDDGSHVYILNGAYQPGKPAKKKSRTGKRKAEKAEAVKKDVPVIEEDPAIIEFLRCIRDRDTDKSHYSTPLMREICDAIEEVRDDPAKEAEYMQYQAKVMDIRREGRAEGRREGRAEGREEGRLEEREAGIHVLVKTIQSLSASKDTAVQQLTIRYALDAETARQKVEQYWLTN